MQRVINRYGEIIILGNEGVFKIPYSKLNPSATKESLSLAYIQGIEKFGMSELIIYSTELQNDGDYFEMKYDLRNKKPFIDVRAFKFSQQLIIFNSLIELGKMELKTKQHILWEKENFLFDTQSFNIKALLFGYEGFPLHIKRNYVDGIRTLIFIGLTTLDKISEKPKRSDFIDQSDKVIAFAEAILNSKTLEDIEQAIEKAINEEVTTIESKEEEKEKKSGKFKKKFFGKRKKKEEEKVDYKDQLKQSLKSGGNQNQQLEEDNRPMGAKIADKILTPKGGIITLCMFAVLGFGAYYYPTLATNNNAELEAKEKQEIKDKTIDSYRSYISGNKEKAYADLDHIGYNNLDEKDKKVLIDFYLEQGKYTKALKTEPDSAYRIGDKFVKKISKQEKKESKEDFEKIAVASDDKVLKFDLATINKEYQSVINMAGSLKKINERRANEIVKAYYLTNQESELETFIKEKEKSAKKKEDIESTNELMALTQIHQQLNNDYKNYSQLQDEFNKLKTELDNANKNNEVDKAKELQAKLDGVKGRKDNAYKQLQNRYITVNYVEENK
ncbi:hypothetical protein [Bacillus pseudomycoides]|uniref:hypothetical protein n=1 Tax=Bacillus pseudomycoides TaxID=64104 RepID=UPI000BEF7FA0|nr:hypothetical protein [Bacillus pseudomycoides]PEM69292.1 hypothetical protein CN619_21385 [Bacillus pseudomycoides]PGA62244.1 hypothetical protein COL84_13820 [Bacillus pseudomycoides]